MVLNLFGRSLTRGVIATAECHSVVAQLIRKIQVFIKHEIWKVKCRSYQLIKKNYENLVNYVILPNSKNIRKGDDYKMSNEGPTQNCSHKFMIICHNVRETLRGLKTISLKKIDAFINKVCNYK